MDFSIVCFGCGHVLYEGNQMILLYRLGKEIDNKCPSCGRKLSLHPLSIEFKEIQSSG